MDNKEKSLVILLLLVTLFKGIVWASLVPMWQAPDEQAHFAQVQYYAELKKEIGPGNDLSLEVYESERLLGTLRDERGINNFTYHPEFRIEYGETLTGIHENQIANLPRSSRTTFVKPEAARYPPLFYVLSATGYFLGYPHSLFVRLFLTRIISVLLAVATVWATFLLAKTIFPKNGLLAISLAALVSFQPMFTFLTSGVNNDNLLNLLSTLLLWLMVDAIREGLSLKHSLGMGVVIGLGILTKQLMYPFIPLPLLLIAYEVFIKKRDPNQVVGKLFPLLFAGLLFGGFVFAKQWIQTGNLPFWPSVTPDSPRFDLTFSTYLSQKLEQLYRETLPWYWGVFKWLGVVLPLSTLRIIKVVIIFSLIGLLKYAIKKLRLRKLETRDWQLLLLAFSSVWFAFWILFWDYMLIRSIGFSHGIQGRNFFPNLAGHLTLIGFGIWQLTSKYRRTLLKAAVLGMLVLNFIALKTMLVGFYDLLPVSTFINQASQYKPWFFKGVGLVIWLVVYLVVLLQFLERLLAYRIRSSQNEAAKEKREKE